MAELDTEVTPVSTFTDDAEVSASETYEIGEDPRKIKRRKRLIIFGVIAGVIVALIAAVSIVKMIKDKASVKDMYTDVAVERRTITKSITGSSSVEPNDSYNVMTMKSGDITADYFTEGDTVKKGDKLYQFDDEDARNSLTTAQNNVAKAQQQYVDAVKQKAKTVSSNELSTKSTQNAINRSLNSLNDAQKSYDNQYIKPSISGKVTGVTVKEGDQINNGAVIATVYSDTYMKLRVPFNDYDAESVSVGDGAEVTVTGSGDVLYGTVTGKASASSAAQSHTMVVYVTIEVTNPGALTENDRGSAVVNGVACADSASFEYINTQKLISKTAGTLETLSIAEGDSVYAGEQVAYVKSDSAENNLSNAKLSYDDAVLNLSKQVLANDTYSQDSAIKNAQLSLDDARVNLKKAEDAVKDYLVEAPIDGTVVKKNAKNGDTRDSSNSTEALCVIYDLSCLKISIEVDETEIALVELGQSARITADAVDGEFEAVVTKVPVDGVNTNGVTTYTIEVQIDDYGDLLPGMNVDAEIIVEEAEDVLTVPVNSVNRGNIVFVKEDGIERQNDVTDKIKNGETGDKPDNGKSDNRKNDNNTKNDSAKDAEQKEDKNSERGNVMQPPVVSGEGTKEVNRGSEKQERQERQEKQERQEIPMNIQIPDGYRAIQVETGINDSDYIEIKSGLGEGDMVRTLNTESSSAGASFGSGNMAGMSRMQGGMSGSMGGGMPGGGMPGSGGARGGMSGGPR